MFNKNNSNNNSLLRLWGITMLYYTIPYTIAVILPIYMNNKGFNLEEIGLIIGIASIVTMTIRPLAGVIIDKFGAKKLYLTALYSYPIIIVLFYIPILPILIIARAISGMSGAFMNTSMQITSIKLVPAELRHKSISFYSLAS